METVVAKKNGKGTKKDVSNVKSSTAVKPEVKRVNGVKKEDAKPIEEVKPIVEKVELSAPPKPELTLDQKIEKIENLKTLIEKREKLEASRKKLNSFIIGSNNFNESIVLTDEHGNTFKASNSEVFAKVIDVINETLVEKITEVEEQIEF